MRISTVSDRSAHFLLSPLQPKSKADISYHLGKNKQVCLSSQFYQFINESQLIFFYKIDVNPNLIRVFYALGGFFYYIRIYRETEVHNCNEVENEVE